MRDKRTAKKISNQPKVVGTIHSPASLKAALNLPAGSVDFFEVRVDAFIGQENKILSRLLELKQPLIITVRHISEGGLCWVSPGKRRECFERFLPYAAWIDIELRFAGSLADVIARARRAKVGIILSHHDFHKTPPVKRLAELSRAAVKAGADILKIATVASTPGDVAALLSLLRPGQKLPLSLMGMGGFGKISRLLFAQAGSVLNYGFLDKAQVSGQWPAVLLKQRIEELLAD